MPDGLWQVVQGYAIHFPGTVAVAVPGQLSTTMTNWPISMQCLADDLIGLGIKSSASPINEDLTLASEVQISRYEMLGCVFSNIMDLGLTLNHWAPNGLVLTFN